MAKISQVSPYERRTGSVRGSLRRVGRPIEWDAVMLGDGMDCTPEGSLVVWVTEHDKDGENLSDEGVIGLVHTKRISPASAIRQYMCYWRKNSRWTHKHHPDWEEKDDIDYEETVSLLVTFQRVKDGDFEDVPGENYDVGIEWKTDDKGMKMPYAAATRKQETKP